MKKILLFLFLLIFFGCGQPKMSEEDTYYYQDSTSVENSSVKQ